MTFLPIVERELRVATRKRSTYWIRVIAAIVAVALTFWIIGTIGRFVTPDLVGAKLFRGLTNLAFFCFLFPGVVLTADCLSQEKREGTLGLLFLTDLKGYDVVLGKLIVTSLNAFYALLAVFPPLAIPLMLGGVTVGEFWRMVIVLVNALFFSLAVGMFASAIGWREQRTMVGTTVAVLFVTYVCPTFGGFWEQVSPHTAFRLAFDADFQKEPEVFIACLALVQAVSWTLLLLASQWITRSWQERSPQLGCASLDRVLAGPRQHARSVLLERDPVQWLACRRRQQIWIWASLVAAVLVWFAANLGPSGRWKHPGWIIFGVICFHAVLQFWIAWEASRRFNEDRRSGALEYLLSTPLSTADIVKGQIISLERQFIPPLVAVSMFDIFLMYLAVHHLSWQGEGMPAFMTVIVALVGVLGIDAYVLAWVGLWLGLSSNKTSQAAIAGLMRIVVLPTGLFLVVMFFILRGGGFGAADVLAGSTVIWALIGGANAHLFNQHAQKKLEKEFRSVAVTRITGMVTPKPPALPFDLREDFSLLR